MSAEKLGSGEARTSEPPVPKSQLAWLSAQSCAFVLMGRSPFCRSSWNLPAPWQRLSCSSVAGAPHGGPQDSSQGSPILPSGVPSTPHMVPILVMGVSSIPRRTPPPPALHTAPLRAFVSKNSILSAHPDPLGSPPGLTCRFVEVQRGWFRVHKEGCLQRGTCDDQRAGFGRGSLGGCIPRQKCTRYYGFVVGPAGGRPICTCSVTHTLSQPRVGGVSQALDLLPVSVALLDLEPTCPVSPHGPASQSAGQLSLQQWPRGVRTRALDGLAITRFCGVVLCELETGLSLYNVLLQGKQGENGRSFSLQDGIGSASYWRS